MKNLVYLILTLAIVMAGGVSRSHENEADDTNSNSTDNKIYYITTGVSYDYNPKARN